VYCYVCNTGEHFNGDKCLTDTLDENLLFNCNDEGLKDNKTYTMCRKFVQNGKSFCTPYGGCKPNSTQAVLRGSLVIALLQFFPCMS